MTDPLAIVSPTTLLSTLCTTITSSIHPLSSTAMNNSGTKLFGAAILHKPTLKLILANTNQESDSPLWHGETYTLTQFFSPSVLAPESRPDPKDCVFLSTHEPCSLCINAIVWSGFDNFVYLWSYEDTERLFGIGGDLKVWRECFYNEGHSLSSSSQEQQRQPQRTTTQDSEHEHEHEHGKQRQHEFYKRVNPMFVARSFDEIIAAIESDEERTEWTRKVDEVKMSYGALSPVFRAKMGIVS